MAELNQEQLAAARAAAWKQTGEPVLTLEAARDWVKHYGLVLFAPLAQLGVGAPSLVEATLGEAKAAPTVAEMETARGLVARLVGEGLALPLNLLGVTAQGSDTPDFVVSTQVFSYVFTMRGDKAWKQPPATSGAVKVSPLGLRVYEVLAERGGMTAMELASELGREVTETAILRALHELWGQLRVIPLLAQGESGSGATLWELTTRRFTKAIKAGANAGQPTALSALVSLYLAQVFAATEEDVLTFLSPLTARSRVREVLHALMGARQLETLVVEGKTLLYVPGTLPQAATGVAGENAAGEEIAAGAEASAIEARPKKVGTGRIRSFEGGRKPADEFRGKPARAVGAGAGSFGGRAKESGQFGAGGGRERPKFGARADGKSDRERRPFKRDGAAAERPGFGKPKSVAKAADFSKPWDEGKKGRGERKGSAGAPDSFRKFRRPEVEDREPLGPREQAGLPPERRTGAKPRAERGGFDRAARPGGFTKRPYTPRKTEGGERPFEKRPYAPREGGERGSFKPRSYEGKAGQGADRGARPEKKPGGFGAKRPYAARSSEGRERPFAKRPYTPRTGEGGERTVAKRPHTPRPAEDGDRTLPKRPYKPRAADAGERKFTKAPWAPGGPGEGGAGKRPYKPRGEGGFGGGGARKSFGGKFAGKFGARPGAARPGGSRPPSRSGAGAGRPAGKFGGKGGGFGGGRQNGPPGGARPSAPKRPEVEEQG